MQETWNCWWQLNIDGLIQHGTTSYTHRAHALVPSLQIVSYYSFSFNNIHEKISPFWLVKSSAFCFVSSAKRSNKPSILIGQWSKKLTDGQSDLLLSNQAWALDGAIYGVIFPWLRDMHVLLLLNHLEIFSCILLTSNHMIFLVQFGINKHLQIFQRPQIAPILLVWKIYSCLFIPICTWNHVITGTYTNLLPTWM